MCQPLSLSRLRAFVSGRCIKILQMGWHPFIQSIRRCGSQVWEEWFNIHLSVICSRVCVYSTAGSELEGLVHEVEALHHYASFRPRPVQACSQRRPARTALDYSQWAVILGSHPTWNSHSALTGTTMSRTTWTLLSSSRPCLSMQIKGQQFTETTGCWNFMAHWWASRSGIFADVAHHRDLWSFYAEAVWVTVQLHKKATEYHKPVAVTFLAGPWCPEGAYHTSDCSEIL